MYAVVDGCEKAHINNLTGEFNWITDFDDAGNYEIIFRVTDTTGLFSEITISAEVININRPPEFVVVLPPGVVVQARNNNNQVFYQFLYMATDPDKDQLTFSLESKIEGCSITSNGVLQFSPHLIQIHNYYVITVVVSDGELSDTTSSKIFIENILVDLEDNLAEIELRNNHQLFQNFPNPFNPSTTIEYTIHTPTFGVPSREENQKGVFVTLKVYDILGREATTLVNEYQLPGKYSVRFNVETLSATSLSNGVYFYRLQTDYFSQTKKMIITK